MKLDQIIAVRKSKTIYRDGDMAIKVFDADYAKSAVLNEALNQVRVEETGLPVPQVRGVTTVEGGKWAIIFDYIEGKTLQSLMDENPDNFDEYLDLFVELQMDIHDARAPLLNKLHEKMNRKISESSLDAATRYDLQSRLDGMPKHIKVCHGDFNPSNIIITDEDKPYIIDWAHVTQGNASADVARTYMLFWLAGAVDRADKYLKLFCEKSVTERQYVERWLPIVAASQSVKDKPEEREFLMRWVSVVDYQ